MEEKKKRTQICFPIDAETRQAIKINAALWNISMNQWIISALRAKLRDKNEKVTTSSGYSNNKL